MVIETILASLFGAGTGIIGTAVGKFFGWLEAKQQIELSRQNNAHELQLLDRQTLARQGEMESELALAQTAAATDVRVASYEHDSRYGDTYRWVASALRLVRPVLTVLLVALTWVIAMRLLNEGAYTEFTTISNQIVYMTSAAISWWFGDRGSSQK